MAALLPIYPSVWQDVDFEEPAGDNKTGKQAVAIALGVVGLLTLIIQFLMAPTHTIRGVNYADVWHAALTLIGGGLLIAGALSLFLPRFIAARRKASADGLVI